MRNWAVFLLKGWNDPGPNAVPHKAGNKAPEEPPAQLPAPSLRHLPHTLSRGLAPRTPGDMPRAGDLESQGQGGRTTFKFCHVVFQGLLESI